MLTIWEELENGEAIQEGDEYAKNHPSGINWQPVDSQGIGMLYDPAYIKPVRRKRTL